MPTPETLSVRRSRGIVWVGDLANSSRLLNDNATAGELEKFLPRLYWLSAAFVESAGGQFIKWTGDGFLGWFETPLYRLTDERANVIEYAASLLAAHVNVTQLGIGEESDRRFVVRQGLSFEHDALVVNVPQVGGGQSLDLMGRGVTLAFRLAGIPAGFPGVVAHEEVVKAARRCGPVWGEYRKMSFTAEQRLKYLKGQRWGSRSVLKSMGFGAPRRGRRPALSTVVGHSKKVLTYHAKSVESIQRGEEPPRPSGRLPAINDFHRALEERYSRGPAWLPEMNRRFVASYLRVLEALDASVKATETAP